MTLLRPRYFSFHELEHGSGSGTLFPHNTAPTSVSVRFYTLIFSIVLVCLRPLTSLGHQEGRRVFWEGPKIFELCPIILIDVQCIFLGAWPPCAPLVTGLVCLKLAGKWNIFSTQNWQNTVYRTYLSRLILVVFLQSALLQWKNE